MSKQRPNPERDRARLRERTAAEKARVADVALLRTELMELLAYDLSTGVFTWRSDRVDARGQVVARAGSPAGTRRGDGYICIHHRKRQYMAHRVAWLFVKGEWPSDLLDHKDRNRANNRWDNLRLADQVLNQHNRVRPGPKSRTGLIGVTLANGKYPQALIRVNRRTIFLGTFDTPELAHAAYMAAKERVIAEGPGVADELAAAASRRRSPSP